MATRRSAIIYRFDSPCGRYCYIGQTGNLDTRIRNHGNVTGNSAISRHCRECVECNRVRQSVLQWEECFDEIGSATGSKRIDDLENKYIDEACEEYISDHHNRFPLNLMAEGAEIDSIIPLRAAKEIYELRKELKEEKTRTGPLKSELKRVSSDRDNLKRKLIEVEKVRDKFRKERDTARKQRISAVRECNKLRKKNDALTSQLSESQQGYRALQKRLVNLEQEQVRLCNENGVLTRKYNQAQEQYHASIDRLASVERELREQERTRIGPLQSSLESAEQKLEGREKLVKQLERKVRGYVKEIARLERKLDDAVARHKRELRRRNRISVTLVIVAAFLFIMIVNPDVLERGRESLFSLLPDDSASATVSVSSNTMTVTPRPTNATSATHTPRPTVTPSVTRTPRPTVTPRSTSTPALTRMPPSTVSPLSEPLPQQFIVVEALGANVRACPRMECEVLAKLVSGIQINVMVEVQGETYRDSALWYRIDLPEGGDDAYIHSSLLGPPASASDS